MYYKNSKEHFTCYKDKGWDLIKTLSGNCIKVFACMIQANNIRQNDNALIFRNNGKPLRQVYIVKETGLSESTVSRCIQELEDNGIIAKRREKVLGVESTVLFVNPDIASIGTGFTKAQLTAMPAFKKKRFIGIKNLTRMKSSF